MHSIRRFHLALAICLAMPSAAMAQREPLVQKELRERFGEWADHYVSSLPSYTALETIRQMEFNRRGQPGNERAATYRYSFARSVGGSREFEESRQRATAGENGERQGKPPNEDSIGLFSKAVLLVTRLAPRYQDRFKYFFVPEHADSSHDFVIVGYRQTSGEGLMEVDGKPVFPTGRAWVDPDDGKVIRIEEEFGHIGKKRYSIAVDFSDDPVTRAWLPVRITVRFFEKERLEMENLYTYADFRPL